MSTVRPRRRKSLHRLRLCLIVVTVLLSLVALDSATADSPTPAAQPAVTLSATVGFDGFYRAGSWVAVAATLSNVGTPVDGTLTVVPQQPDFAKRSVTSGAVVSLPTNSRKAVSFAAPAPLTPAGHWIITYQANGREIASTEVRTIPIGSRDYLIGVMSATGLRPPLAQQRLFGHTVSVASVSPASLSTSVSALQSLDALVLDDTPSSWFSPAAIQALTAWINSGGQLILGGGARATETLLRFRQLTSTSVTGLETVNLATALHPWLSSQSGVAPTDEVVARYAVPKSAIVRLTSESLPLVTDIPVGQGWVTLLGPSAHESLLTTTAASSFWERLLSGEHPHVLSLPPVDAQVGQTNGLIKAAYLLPQAALPSSRAFFLFFLAYILIVGPLNFWVLGRLDHREWLWMTIPVISLLSTGVAYAAAVESKGTSVLVNEVAIVHVDAETSRAVDGVYAGAVGIFSPGPAHYDVSLDRVDGAYPVRQGFGTADSSTQVLATPTGVFLPRIPLRQWSLRVFAVSGEINASALPSLETNLTYSSSTATAGQLSGTITNTGKTALLGPIVVFVGHIFNLPTLEPGASTTVHLIVDEGSIQAPIPSRFSGPQSRPTPEQQLRTSLLDALLQYPGSYPVGPTADQMPGGVHVYAFTQGTPFTTAVAGHTVSVHALTLYDIRLPVQIKSKSAVFPAGLTNLSLLQNSGVTTPLSFTLPLGTVTTLQFRIPVEILATHITTLRLRLNFGPVKTTPQVQFELYNWSTGQWDRQRTWSAGLNTIASPGTYVDPRGYLRLRITGANGQIELFSSDIEGAVAGQ
ncbi:MAG: hypothetical protein M1296_04155 [Chloroflexi bacterium]|nr:hypothetical protein [Chloroflexota bacterium]